jgi:hypothetical protein
VRGLEPNPAKSKPQDDTTDLAGVAVEDPAEEAQVASAIQQAPAAMIGDDEMSDL